MATKPNEIRHSQVSCELENYCLQRGQSLSYSVDLNSESVDQLTDSEAVESVDSDPSVSITLDTNEFGSTLLHTILSGRYAGYPDETFSVVDIQENPVDLLVSVKEDPTSLKANRSAWFNHCYVDSFSGTYQVDSFATESVSLSGNGLKWFLDSDSTNFGATRILKFNHIDGTAKPDVYFDDPTITTGELHALTDNGQLVPPSFYSFDKSLHTITPTSGSDYSFVDDHRYRGVIYNRPEFPLPNDVNDPIGGLVSKEIEVVMWDENVDNIDWQTKVGTDIDKQALRVQSIDYEVSFDREVLQQTMTGLFGQSSSSVNITATISVLDSDLEHWARMSGNWADYTTDLLKEISLSDFQNMSSLSCRIDLFNSKEILNHTQDELLKQLYFSGGKMTSISDSRDTPGRGTQTFEVRFSQLMIRGTGAQGRASSTLWFGSEFAFVFMSDDGVENNIGWAEAANDVGAKITLAVNAYNSTSAYDLPPGVPEKLYKDGHSFINHGYNHCQQGWDPDRKDIQGYGSFYGYHSDASGWADTDPNFNFSSWDDPADILTEDAALPYYLGNMDRGSLTYQAATGLRIPFMPFDKARHGAFPQNAFTVQTCWDLYRSGYRAFRGGTSWSSTYSHWPTPEVDGFNTREKMMMFPIPSAFPSVSICGDATEAFSEDVIKSNIASAVSSFKSGGDNEGGICVLFTHSFGTDRFSGTFPNGWPQADGILVPWYDDGIRKQELKWILEEAIKQGGKSLTFAQAVDQFWEYGHFVNNPETVYGQDYTQAIIFAAGSGPKYPTGENYDDLPYTSVDQLDISYSEGSGYCFDWENLVNTGVLTGDIRADAITVHIKVSESASSDVTTAWLDTATGFIAGESNESIISSTVPNDFNKFKQWRSSADELQIFTYLSKYDLDNGWFAQSQGYPSDANLYYHVRCVYGGEEFTNKVRRKSALVRQSVVAKGDGGFVTDTG